MLTWFRNAWNKVNVTFRRITKRGWYTFDLDDTHHQIAKVSARVQHGFFTVPAIVDVCTLKQDLVEFLANCGPYVLEPIAKFPDTRLSRKDREKYTGTVYSVSFLLKEDAVAFKLAWM
jgi:hypothetical protein